MGTYTKTISAQTSSSSFQFTCDYTNGHKDSAPSISVGYCHIDFDLSSIPENSQIVNLTFDSTSKIISGSQYSAGTSVWIFGENNTKATSSSIKKWLESNKKSDGFFPDIRITAQVTIAVPSSHSLANVGSKKTISGSTRREFTLTLTIDYEDLPEINKPSPFISNFSLTDNYKTKNNIMAFFSEANPCEPTEEEIIYKLEEFSDNYPEYFNCFYKNLSSLTFTAESVTTSQTSNRLYYNLKIKKSFLDSEDSEPILIYEKISSEDKTFILTPDVFSGEDFNQGQQVLVIGEDGEPVICCVKYIFEYTAYDLAGKRTSIIGSMYFLNTYQIPTIQNFSVKRVEEEIDENGQNIFIENPEGNILATDLSFFGSYTYTKIREIKPENYNYNYFYTIDATNSLINSLKYQKIYAPEDGESISSEVILKEIFDFQISQDINFFKKENGFEENTVFILKVIVEDDFFSISREATILAAFSYLNIELTGVAIGGQQKTGTEERPTFDINLPTYVKQEINLVENAAIKGVIILQNGISYGQADPSTIFTEANNLIPQEGQIYFKLL